MTVRIITGDALEQLRLLPSESVHMCCTSPPYFGLRDYGTAQWEGGDIAGCDHLNGSLCSDKSTLAGYTSENIKLRTNGIPFKTECGKCGAVRIDRQIGLEPSPDEYVAALVAVFREVRRVLRSDGTLWLNIGDSYANGGRDSYGTFKPDTKQATQAAIKSAKRPADPPGIKPKDLIGIPWMLAFALRADGWWLRQDIIWSKPNPMPESVTDRCTKAHEYLFLLSKSERYWFDAAAIKEPGTDRPPGNHGHKYSSAYAASQSEHHRTAAGLERMRDGYETRNKRSVWTVAGQPFSESHFATFPPALIEPCILAGCPKHTCSKCGTVLDSYLDKRARAGTNGYNVQSVSGGVQSPSIGGKAQPLLQPGMQICGASGDEADAGLPLVRSAGHTGPKGAGSGFLQQGLCIEVDSKEPQHDQGSLRHIEGVHSGLPTGSSERQQGRLCDGTPAGDGADRWAPLAAERGCAPSRRGPAEQRRGEPRTSVEIDTRQVAESANGVDPLPALRGEDPAVSTCPGCGAALDGIGAITPGVVLDCFGGAGTTGLVADRLGRDATLIELNPEYAQMAERRIHGDSPLFANVAMHPPASECAA